MRLSHDVVLRPDPALPPAARVRDRYTARGPHRLETLEVRPMAPEGADGPDDDAPEPAHGGPEIQGARRAWDEAEGEGSAAEEAARERAVDHALIRRAQAGEEAAFAELVARHQHRAWRVAKNLVANEEDAQDLAQEAFLRVFRNLASFDFEHGFTTWLYRIVTNLAIDHLRKRRPVRSTTQGEHAEEGAELELADGEVDAPSANLERAEIAQEVHAVLSTLAPHFQSVILLREIEGLPCNEIAKIVGATHVTVRWRLHRGRKLFQEEWERRARWTDQVAGDRGTGRSDDEDDDPSAEDPIAGEGE